ncbi:MAG: ABC transporter permease [Planctomycetota bacterium]
MKKYQVLISQKYLRSRMVNVFAVVAVMLGVAALIIVSSVMDGFARDIQTRIRGIMSHVVVESGQLVGIGDYERLTARIEKVPQVKACAPLVECPFVLIRVGSRTRFGQLRGIDLERETKTSEIEAYIRRAADEPEEPGTENWTTHDLAKRNLDFKYDTGGEPEYPGALLGNVLARRLGAFRPGDEITVTSPTTILTFQSQKFNVVGAFRCGHYEYDDRLMYVSLRAAQDLLGLPDRVTSISVRLHDIRDADDAKDAIARAIRNETPLINPADPQDAKRIEKTAGAWSILNDDGRSWIRMTPSGAARSEAARIAITRLAPALEKADGATAIAFDARRTEAAAGRAPSFQVRLADSAGRSYYPDSEYREWYAPTRAGHTFVFDLANFISEDGLDLLDPADVRGAEFTVFGLPLELGNIRFVDDRRVGVSSWRDKQASLLRAVDVERYIQVIIMSLMVVIAGFSIMAILWLMVREKTRDIGVLMSLGATRGGIVRIFLLNGLMIGTVGSALGLTLGWVISANLNVIESWLDHAFGWRVFPPSIYYLDKLPHQESPVQFIVFALAAMAVSLVAAVWPAIKASRLDPIEALRYE